MAARNAHGATQPNLTIPSTALAPRQPRSPSPSSGTSGRRGAATVEVPPAAAAARNNATDPAVGHDMDWVPEGDGVGVEGEGEGKGGAEDQAGANLEGWANAGLDEPLQDGADRASEGNAVDVEGNTSGDMEEGQPNTNTSADEGQPNVGSDENLLHWLKPRNTRRDVTVEEYPDPCAGAPVRPETYPVEKRDLSTHPLTDPRLFETAHWLGNVPISENDMRSFFLHENYTHGPSWRRRVVTIKGDTGEEKIIMWVRNSLAGVLFLLSNKKFVNHMRYSPEVHWLVGGRRQWLYSEMWMAMWWWRVQSMLKRGATVVPIILSTDKTQLSTFGGQKAWPVYLSIGNISKKLRRRPSQGAMILIAFLPVTDLSCVTSPAERRQKSWNLFHACMLAILEPIKDVSEVGIEALCANGYVRRIHPILAAYIADFPEQCLVTCARANRCPVCVVPADERGSPEEYAKRQKKWTLDAVDDYAEGHRATAERRGVRPVWPFWADLPFVDIATCITPDLLHQLNKGVFKDHVVKWCTKLLGKEEVDRRLKGMPRFHGLRHFTNGISIIKQWMGEEAKQLAKAFLPVVAGCDEGEAVGAARSILDFMYRAHMPEMSDDDLEALEHDLADFHDLKGVFGETGALDTDDMFDGIPKIHMLSHYAKSIRELGTTDGYNSETPERLHIDYVKDRWWMSNHVNPLEQMAHYLQRKECWAILRAYHRDLGQLPASVRDWDAPLEDDSGEGGIDGPINGYVYGERDNGDVEEGEEGEEGEDVVVPRRGRDDGGSTWYPAPGVSLAKRGRKRPGSYLIDKHGATNLIRDTLAFLKRKRPERRLLILNETHHFYLWTRCKLSHGHLPFLPSVDPHVDHVRAAPASYDDVNRVTRFGSFDTVLFPANSEGQGLHRYEAGRIRAIFELPRHLRYLHGQKLVYVEHFRPFSKDNQMPHRLLSTKHAMTGGARNTSVIPLSLVRMACHLAPRYKQLSPDIPVSSTADLLSSCDQFYFNKYSSHFVFTIIDYWRKQRAYQRVA